MRVELSGLRRGDSRPIRIYPAAGGGCRYNLDVAFYECNLRTWQFSEASGNVLSEGRYILFCCVRMRSYVYILPIKNGAECGQYECSRYCRSLLRMKRNDGTLKGTLLRRLLMNMMVISLFMNVSVV